MAHISFSPPKDAKTFTPLTKAYDRVTKDGSVPVINFLLGSQYNAKIGGEISITSVGNITNDTLKAISGKLEIAAESVDGTEVEKIGNYITFMYFYPGVKIGGNSEIQDADVGAGPVPVQRMRHVFEDLSTGDQIIVDLQGGDGNAQLVLRERVDNVVTDLVTQEITAAVTNVNWELDFLEDAITKFHFKEPAGVKTRIFNGTLKANIAEAKLSVKNILDQQLTKTLKSDFMWIFYPNVFVAYDVALKDRLGGRIRVFDDEGFPADETKWTEVFSGDHEFVGLRVIENGLVRLIFKTTPEMEVWGWDTTAVAWVSIGSIIPKTSQGDLATILQDVIFDIYNDSQVKLIAKYGIVDHIVDMKRGGPYVRIVMNSKEVRVKTTKERFAISVDDTATEIPDFNQKNTDDANRGNPLNLSPTNNPFIFTNDSNLTTGLLLLDDNWFGWYNDNATDMVGWLGVAKRPTGLTVTATSATQLSTIDWKFDKDMVISIGVLNSTPTIDVNGIPTPFNIGSIDEYVKWRANESIIGFNQRMFLRKKR